MVGRLNIVMTLIVAATVALAGCSRTALNNDRPNNGRLQVVVSLYPIYDFTKNVAGGFADVSLILPPGAEPHSFEPRPVDIVNISRADLFIHTGGLMEPWIGKILGSAEGKKYISVDAGRGVEHLPAGDDDHGHKSSDPHIWLDLGNASIMVDNIADALSAADPANSGIFRRNADIYKQKLMALDESFRKMSADCRKKVFISGGHYTFGYLAKRYGLKYMAAYGVSPDSEPSAKHIASLSRQLREYGLNSLFYDEILEPRIANTIASETGAELLRLHGAHNISSDEFNKGVSFLDLMEKNRINLMKGLQCSR